MTLTLATCLLAASVGAALVAAAPPEHEAPQHLVVRFRDLPGGVAAGATLMGLPVVRADAALDFAVVRLPSAGASAAAAAAAALASAAGVLGVEPDALVRLADATPNDPRFGSQHGLARIRAPAAWDVTRGSADVAICVVDTGVRNTHEDIQGARWLGGRDFVDGDDRPWDHHGHGTHVAGIAAATSDNGKGVAGVAQAGILAARVMDATGSGTTSMLASAIRWCADGGAEVITMSLSTTSDVAHLRDAVRYAWEKGSLLVAANGNVGPCSDCVKYPARYDEVIAVACTTSADAQCSFSAEGAQTELAAPGQGIEAPVHTSDSAYAKKSGTSMAAPHVAGVAALVWSAAPGLANADVRRILRESARDLGSAGRDHDFGFGLVDARAAVDAARAAAGGFEASFSFDGGGNANWVETRVSANRPLAGVDARVDGGAWVALELKSWGEWARRMSAPDGSAVEFRARATSGESVESVRYSWPEATPVSSFAAGFSTDGGGNAWWVEVTVEATAPLAGVDARVDGGAWVALELKSWGEWARGMKAPAGSVVEFRARAAAGDSVVSAPFPWPA